MKHLKYLTFVLVLATIGAVIFSTAKVLASWGTPSQSVGYFTNDGVPHYNQYGHILSSGLTGVAGIGSYPTYSVPTKQAFVNEIISNLAGQTKYIKADGHQNQTGAAFIIMTMLGGAQSVWPTSSNIQDWQNRILKNDDLVLTVAQNFSNPNGHNSGYDPVTFDDAWLITSSNTATLEFRSKTTNTVYYRLKIDCANAVGDSLPGIPLVSPVITVHRINESGNENGPYSLDTISATGGGSNNNIPSVFTVSAGSIDVTAANNLDLINPYRVIAYYTFTCLNGSNPCPNPPKNKVSFPLPLTPPYTYTFTAKDGYTYDLSFIYQAIPSAKPVTISGYKVDTNNNVNTAFNADTVSANNASGTVQSSTNPFNLNVTVPLGSSSIRVSVTDNVKDWSVTGSTFCDPAVTNCNNPITLKTLFQTGTYRDVPVKDGGTYYMNWVYKQVPPICTGSSCAPIGCPSLPNPLVTVPLPDNTAYNSPPPASTTSPNSPYNWKTSLGTTVVTGVTDKSVSLFGGNSVLPILVSPKLNTATSQNQAVLDYSPYIKTYPYDNNRPTVSYYHEYKVSPYISSSSASGYTCSNGTSPNPNHTCTTTTHTGSIYYANVGVGTTTTVTKNVYITICYVKGVGIRYAPNCGIRSSSTSTTTTYTCPSSYPSGGGTTSLCYVDNRQTTTTYPPAQPYYNYIPQSSYNAKTYNSVDGALMTDCYSRRFIVTAVNSAAANVGLNNLENPTAATAGGYTAGVKFLYPSNGPQNVGLRQAMKANLTYSYKFSNNSSVLCTGNNAFTVTGSFGPSGPSYYPVSGAGCSVSLPPLQPGDTVCAAYTVLPDSGTMNSSGTTLTSSGVSVLSGSKCSGKIVNEPYFKVFGGDVSAGSAFATTSSSGAVSCSGNSSNSTAGVYGWNTAGGGGGIYTQTYAGSGAQFAVTAPNVILGVASNQNNKNAYPSAGGSPNPLGLSFSNMVNNSAPAGQFGGNLTASACITDFYSSLPATVKDNVSGSQNLNGLDGVYTMSGGSTINQSNITSGKHVTIYATGNIFINDNITFPGSYPTIDQIPSLILIVKGNIYISNLVTNLSGIFIAQPTTSSSNDGYIYDCAATAGVVVSNNSIYSGCGNQLVVNGSFIANKVSLMRTGISTGSPTSSSLRGSSTNETNTSTSPAEIFNYGPAFWMNLTLPQATSTGTSSAGYDSIISLPPIL